MMPTLAWMKKLTAILLLVCFVLPLSRCETKGEVAGVVHTQVDYAFGYGLVLDSFGKVGSGLPDFSTLILVAIVFFIPAITLAFKERWQPLILLCAAFPAMYALYMWVYAFATQAMIGGILAVECWLFLLSSSATVLWFRWFSKRKLRAAEPV